MKKIPILALLVLFTMCKTKVNKESPILPIDKNSNSVEVKIEEKEEYRLPVASDIEDLPTYAQVKDDFRSVSEKTKTAYLQGMKATDPMYSVIILTKGYQGENITVKNEDKNFFKAMTMTDHSTGIANSIRVDNTQDIILIDNFTQGSLSIKTDHAKLFKFIYIMKNNSDKETPFRVTFSNTLRPVR